MEDKRYFELRMLTEAIYDLRENIMKKIKIDSFANKKAVETYEELCKKRDRLEIEIFG